MNVGKYFWTIINLSPAQMLFQIRYRTRGFKKAKVNRKDHKAQFVDVSIEALDEDDLFIGRFRIDEILQNRLWLLNEAEELRPGVWNYTEKSHLWNFNLHYFEFAVALAAGYKKTGDARYYEKLKELYLDWHDTCYETGNKDAWHPYTVSLRLKNILIISGLLGDRRKEWSSIVENDLYEQYVYLMHNQEKHLMGNHYFENLTTLCLCSKYFNDKRNKNTLFERYIKEVDKQILADGMHYERSFMYHNLIMEDILRVYKASDEDFRQKMKHKLQSMADCIYSFEFDDRLPAFNDSGSNVAKRKSRLIMAAKDVADIRPRLKKALLSGGYFRFDSDRLCVIIDAGIVSPKNVSGHAHCDMLSFELFYDGIPILVNAGTYQYQSDFRAYFRSTMAHNTLQAVGTEQSELWAEHRVGRKARLIRRKVDGNRLMAEMVDYKGNHLRRRIETGKEIRITDSASVPFVSYWHIHPANSVTVLADNKVEICNTDGNAIQLVAEKGKFEDVTSQNRYSEEFGKLSVLPSFALASGTVKIIKM